MPAPIQIRRSATAAPGAMPLFGPTGELTYSIGGFTDLPVHVAGNDLTISDGTKHNVLIGPTRQIELIGAQTITGRKTFGLPAISILGGNADDTLQTDGAGNLVWAPVAAGGITSVTTDAVTITGDGTAGDPIALITGIFMGAGSGLTYAPGAVSVTQATQTVFGGLFIASDIEVTAGASDVEAITPRSLRVQFGADIATLTTTVKTIVPAINELQAEITALTGVLTMCGSYDAATDNVTSGNPLVPSGPLPAASAANNAAYLIITVAGLGTGNAPAVQLEVGSWIVSDGTDWIYIDVSQGTVDASNVAVVPPVMGANNVYDALVALEARVVVTDMSLAGDGTAASPLTIILVDGGTF